MRILIRQGTAARDLEALVKGLDPSLSRRCCFCTDDKLPGDILSEGHIDSNVRGAIREGVAPAEALRLATINGAEAYGLDDRGLWFREDGPTLPFFLVSLRIFKSRMFLSKEPLWLRMECF